MFISLYKCQLRHFFLNFPSFPLHHSRHSSMAFSLASGELAGWKLSHVFVASRKHISAKKRVCKSLLRSKSINSDMEFSANFFRLSANSSFFTFAFHLFSFVLKSSAPVRRRPFRRRFSAADKSIHIRPPQFRANQVLQ